MAVKKTTSSSIPDSHQVLLGPLTLTATQLKLLGAPGSFSIVPVGTCTLTLTESDFDSKEDYEAVTDTLTKALRKKLHDSTQ